MKKILVLCILFLCSSWPIFAADSDYACVYHKNIDLNLTRELEKYLYLHFTKDFGHLPVAIVDATHIHFKNNPDVFAFYNPNDNYIYFKDKDIVNRLNDKYILHPVIHELTHFYQNNYGNKLPEGGTPDTIAMLMLKFAKEEVDKWDFETAYEKIIKQLEYKKNSDILWQKAKNYYDINPGWENFKKAAIAEGTACLMAIKVSGTFYYFVGNELAINREDYLRIFIPIYMKFHPTMPVTMKERYLKVIFVLDKEYFYASIKKGAFDKRANFIAMILKNYGNVLKPIERK